MFGVVQNDLRLRCYSLTALAAKQETTYVSASPVEVFSCSGRGSRENFLLAENRPAQDALCDCHCIIVLNSESNTGSAAVGQVPQVSTRFYYLGGPVRLTITKLVPRARYFEFWKVLPKRWSGPPPLPDHHCRTTTAGPPLPDHCRITFQNFAQRR